MRNESSKAHIAVEELGIIELLLRYIDIDATEACKAIRDCILYCSVEVAVISLQSSVDIAVR